MVCFVLWNSLNNVITFRVMLHNNSSEQVVVLLNNHCLNATRSVATILELLTIPKCMHIVIIKDLGCLRLDDRKIEWFKCTLYWKLVTNLSFQTNYFFQKQWSQVDGAKTVSSGLPILVFICKCRFETHCSASSSCPIPFCSLCWSPPLPHP